MDTDCQLLHAITYIHDREDSTVYYSRVDDITTEHKLVLDYGDSPYDVADWDLSTVTSFKAYCDINQTVQPLLPRTFAKRLLNLDVLVLEGVPIEGDIMCSLENCMAEQITLRNYRLPVVRVDTLLADKQYLSLEIIDCTVHDIVVPKVPDDRLCRVSFKRCSFIKDSPILNSLERCIRSNLTIAYSDCRID